MACVMIGWRSRNAVAQKVPRERPRFSRLVRGSLAVLVLAPLLAVGSATAPQATLAYFTDTPTVTSPVDGIDAAPWFTCNQGMSQSMLDPLIYYPLNDPVGSTTAVDASGNGHTGTALGDYLFGQAQPCNRDADTGVWLGGTNGMVHSTDVSGITGTPNNRWNEFSVSLWFRGDNQSGGGGLLSMNRRVDNTDATQDRVLYVDDVGRLRWGVYPNGYRTIVTPAPGQAGYHDYRLAEWHMVTASLSSATGLTLHIDGDPLSLPQTEQGTLAANVTSGFQFASRRYTAYWLVGEVKPSWPGTYLNFWRGGISKVGFWDRALTDQEIRDLYRSGLPIIP